jgi:hypothetical protein
LVKRHFAQLAAHCRLRQLRDGVNGVVHLVPSKRTLQRRSGGQGWWGAERTRL